MPKTAARTFRATLERAGERLKWVIARIPFDVRKAWNAGGRPKVKGEINGFAFRTSLFPSRNGGHLLLVNKHMQSGGHARPGAVAELTLEPDTEERTVTVPSELKRILAANRSLRRWFDALNYSTRHEIANWVTNVKSAEARDRRAAQIAERMMSTMEAERELPPIMRVAFDRQPRAREGWEQMSPSHRRAHLLGLFGYCSPESRARRLEKILQDAIAHRDKKQSKAQRLSSRRSSFRRDL